jgi:hypothetical protein
MAEPTPPNPPVAADGNLQNRALVEQALRLGLEGAPATQKNIEAGQLLIAQGAILG